MHITPVSQGNVSEVRAKLGKYISLIQDGGTHIFLVGWVSAVMKEFEINTLK